MANLYLGYRMPCVPDADGQVYMFPEESKTLPQAMIDFFSRFVEGEKFLGEPVRANYGVVRIAYLSLSEALGGKAVGPTKDEAFFIVEINGGDNSENSETLNRGLEIFLTHANNLRFIGGNRNHLQNGVEKILNSYGKKLSEFSPQIRPPKIFQDYECKWVKNIKN